MKYREIMSKVAVTPQMRERVLENVAMHRQSEWQSDWERQNPDKGEAPADDRNRKITPIWRYLPVVAAACLALVIGVVVQRNRTIAPLNVGETSNIGETPYVGEAPVVGETSGVDLGYCGPEEYSSLEELEKGVGFSVDEAIALADNLPSPAASTAYSQAVGIARVDYTLSDGNMVTLSKAVDDGSDISGDYNEYNAVSEETINGVSVTLKGNDDTISLATFTREGYAYAIDCINGVSKDAMVKMAEAVLG